MSEEQLKAFLEKVQVDTSLQEKLKAAVDANSVAAIAKEAGFMISADDLKKDQAIEISEEELEGVTGGTVICLIALSKFGYSARCPAETKTDPRNVC